MNLVHLLPVGKLDGAILRELRDAIPRRLHVACEVLPYELDPTPSYHAERQQYHSSEILQRMQALVRAHYWRLLAIANVNLYIPILKYVFGEAQMGGPCAVVSVHRLRQRFTASIAMMPCSGRGFSRNRSTSWGTRSIFAIARTIAA